MNWEQLKSQLDAAVKKEAVAALDKAIEQLRTLRAAYASEEPVAPPEPAAMEKEKVSVIRTAPPRPTYPTKRCSECMKMFSPTHHRQKFCNDCRSAPQPTKKYVAPEPANDVRSSAAYASTQAMVKRLSQRPDAVKLPDGGAGAKW